MLVMVVFFIAFRWIHLSTPLIRLFLLVLILLLMPTLNFRSEERRVGKECTYRRSKYHLNKEVREVAKADAQAIGAMETGAAGSGVSVVFFSSRRRHTRSVSAFLLNRSSDLILIV